MDKEKQRIAIAKVCGKNTTAFRFFWKREDDDHWFESPHYITHENAEGARIKESSWSNTKPVEEIESGQNVPNYLNDLNAMHEAEKILDSSHLTAYWHYLFDVNRRYQGSILAPSVIYMITSTAEQRAEAFLRTIGKWE